MGNKIMFKNDYSCIVIRDDKMYILSNKYRDYSFRAFTIASGFQIELGRPLSDIESALRETRLPIVLKELTTNGEATYYQIIRMHTGKVDDKIIANMMCKNGIITMISFNRALIKDKEYRRYNSLSVLHQLSIPFNLEESDSPNRGEQVRKTLKTVIPMLSNIKVTENGNQLMAITTEEGLTLKFLFISNKQNNNRYELTSISLA